MVQNADFRSLCRLPALAILLLLTPLKGHSQDAGTEDRDKRLAKIQEAVGLSVADLKAQLASPATATPSIRDLPNAALAKLIISQDAPGAEALLRREFAEQNMDAASQDFGALPWQIGHPEIRDANAIEFGMQSIGPIWLGYGRLLSGPFKKEMIPHLKAALVAMRRHEVKVTYTNIFLMKAVNLILVGEAAADEAAAAEGYAHLDEWMDFTRKAGISEFDSPTYYAVDLGSLAMGYRYAARPEGRAKFKAALDYVWRDIAANYFPPRRSLSGPHSRDYDFLRGTGALDIYLYAEGLKDGQDLKKLDLGKALLLETCAAYHPPAAILAPARAPGEKIVTQRWETAPASMRCNYITSDFAIGSTSGDYGPQDKLFSVELGGAKSLPVISVVPDIYDSPYGLMKIKGSDGHDKPRHIPAHLTAAQDHGTVLLLFDLDPRNEKDPATVSTNIILPAEADQLLVDGKQVSVSPALAEPAKVGSVLGVRQGNAGIAIRIFMAEGCAGQAPELVLKADPAGIKEGALRLAIYHYRGNPMYLADSHIRVGLLVTAAHCETDAGFATLLGKAGSAVIDQKTDSGVWKVQATSGDLALEAARDLGQRSILYRRINGKDATFPPLSLNGKEINLE